MTPEPDYYAILQVDPRADPDVIDAAYRKLAAKYHPDVNRRGDATARMQQLNEAHRTLSDPELRAAYDWRKSRNAPPPEEPPVKIPPFVRQFRNYLLWFLGLFLMGEAFQRVGSRGVLIVIILGGLAYLLWKSKKWF
jgi:curved DNA-binding protein CbpA